VNVKVKLAIELDGSQHCGEERMEYERRRLDYLNRLGLEILRITNNGIWDSFKSLCEAVDYLVQLSGGH